MALKRTTIRPVSKRQARELVLRRKVKQAKWERFEGRCEWCGCSIRSIGEAELAHLQHNAEGRVTSEATTALLCHACHHGAGGHKTIMPPKWSSGKAEK